MISADESISITPNAHSIEWVNAKKRLGITIDKKIDLGPTD